MLRPPGSTAPRSKAQASNRRKTQESPEDQIKQLQRLYPNKRCADCGVKLPQYVNLTYRTFICTTCAGFHRELTSKVKGIGHTNFTQEEVDEMKTTDNDQVNAIWLGRYNPNVDRMKQPEGNQNQQELRAWIRRKYQDKAWYMGGSDGGNDNRRSAPGPSTTPSRAPQGGFNNQPTMVQMPPAATKKSSQEQDFLAFRTETSPPANDGWDAFGGSSSNQTSNQPAGNDPFAATQPPPQQQQNFANFGSQQQQSDPFAAPAPPLQPPPPVQQQQNFANFGPPQPVNDFANFNQAQPPQGMQQQQQQPFQQQNFANFGGPPQQPPGAFMAQNAGGMPPQQQESFAAFDQMQPQQQPQPPMPGQHMNQHPTHPGGIQPWQNAGGMPPQQQGFDQMNPSQAFQPSGLPTMNQQQYPGASMQEQHAGQMNNPTAGMVPMQGSQMQTNGPGKSQQAPGFAAFGQMQPEQQINAPTGQGQQPNMQQQPATLQGFAAFDEIQPTQQPQYEGMALQQQASVGTNMPQQQSGTAQEQGPSMTGPNNFPGQTNMMQLNNAMPGQPQQGFGAFNQLEHQSKSMVDTQPQPNPPAPKETSVISDAFANLAVGGDATPPALNMGSSQSAAVKKSSTDVVRKYSASQIVCYKSDGKRYKAKVLSVHLDDELEPFYSIMLEFGKEKQTDDAHLEELDPRIEKIESIIMSLSPDQLTKVEALAQQLAASSGSQGSPPIPPPASSPVPPSMGSNPPTMNSMPSGPTGPPPASAPTMPPPQLSQPVINRGAGGMLSSDGGFNSIPSPEGNQTGGSVGPTMGMGGPDTPQLYQQPNNQEVKPGGMAMMGMQANGGFNSMIPVPEGLPPGGSTLQNMGAGSMLPPIPQLHQQGGNQGNNGSSQGMYQSAPTNNMYQQIPTPQGHMNMGMQQPGQQGMTPQPGLQGQPNMGMPPNGPVYGATMQPYQGGFPQQQGHPGMMQPQGGMQHQQNHLAGHQPQQQQQQPMMMQYPPGPPQQPPPMAPPPQQPHPSMMPPQQPPPMAPPPMSPKGNPFDMY